MFDNTQSESVFESESESVFESESESKWKEVWVQFEGREADVDVFDELELFPGWEVQSRSTTHEYVREDGKFVEGKECDVVVVGVEGDETWVRFAETDMGDNGNYVWVPEKRIKCDSCDSHEYPPDLALFDDKCEDCAEMTREEAEQEMFG